MDNASKALIIAGAILIAVMLVSLGVMLYNTAAGVAEGTISSMEALGADGFNKQFTQSFGKRKSATVCQGLIDKVITSNQTGENTIYITSTGNSKVVGANGVVTTQSIAKSKIYQSKDLTALRNLITSRDTVYDIEVDSSQTGGGYNNSGYITYIKITAQAK